MRKTSKSVRDDLQDQPGGQRLVMVVDDSRLQRHLVCNALRQWDFDVVEAGSGEEALALCRDRMPDVVLSDWMMPGMSGLDLCQAFRDLPEKDYLYFILLTSKSEKAEVAAGLDSGADDFLSKPVNNNELRARITAGERIVNMQRELSEKNRLITSTLDELQRIHDSIDRDLMEAKKLQQSLLRERFRAFDTGRLSLMLHSSGHVGGDLVGFFPAGAGQLGLYAIDVSGHGISSALMTARLAGYLSASAPEQNIALKREPGGGFVVRRPEETLELLNTLVLTEMETEHYFTFMLAIIDQQSGKVVIGQAGHPHPAIQRTDGSVIQSGTGGFPLGLVSGVGFDQFDIQLSPGDRLLILSDGVTECPDPSGALLGEEGLSRFLRQSQNIHDNALMDALIWELARFSETDEFPDDVSGVLFEYEGHPPAR